MCSRRSINININSIVIPTRVSRCIKIAYTIHNARQSLRWIKYRQRILQKRDRRILSNFFYKTLMLNSNIEFSILCPFLRGRQRVLSKDEGTSVEDGTKTSTIPWILPHSSPTKHHDLSTSCPLSSWNDSVTVSVWHARGSRISPSRKKRIYLSRWHAITISSILRAREVDRWSKWYRDGDHWISSVFFVERRIYVYIERKKFVTWKLYYLYFYRQFEVWWVFEILWYDEKDEILWQYSMKEDVL